MVENNKKNKKTSTTKIRLWVDIILFIGIVLTLAPQATGIPLHEWASFLVIIPILIHILLDWKWIVGVTKRLFVKLPGETRFNHFWDTLLFILMTAVIFTGVVISEAALPAVGISSIIDPFWSTLHDVTANLLMAVTGVHIAMHWKWIVNACKRYILRQPKTTSKATS